jgi:hypothetical protein
MGQLYASNSRPVDGTPLLVCSFKAPLSKAPTKATPMNVGTLLMMHKVGGS